MLLAYNLVTKSQHMMIHLPIVNFGAKSKPNSFDAHRIKALCL